MKNLEKRLVKNSVMLYNKIVNQGKPKMKNENLNQEIIKMAENLWLYIQFCKRYTSIYYNRFSDRNKFG